MTLKLCCKNDFIEQITIVYWLFYALLNNQQFMKTTFHKYGHRFLSGDCQDLQQGRIIGFPILPLSSFHVRPTPGLGSHVAPHPGTSSGTQETIYKVPWRSLSYSKTNISSSKGHTYVKLNAGY